MRSGNMDWRGKWVVLAVGCALCLGCGSSSDRHKAKRPKTARAEGTVTYKGQPLEGAIVVLHPTVPQGIAAMALTNASGKFIARAYPPDSGAVPGVYKVTVEKMLDAGPSTASPENHDAPPPPPPKSLIPKKYSKPESTPLKAEISEAGSAEIKLELVD
jgi:hypothetical protein